MVKGTGGKDGEGILRVDSRESDDTLEEISWGEFFETYEDRKLAVLHQDRGIMQHPPPREAGVQRTLVIEHGHRSSNDAIL